MSYFSGPLTIATVLLPLEDMTLSFAHKFAVLDICAPSPLFLTSTGVSCNSGLSFGSC